MSACPPCVSFLNDFFTGIAFAALYVGAPAAIGFIPAFICLAWDKYAPGRIITLAPHPIIFWIAYPLVYLATGAGYWITWFYGDKYCGDSWLPLIFLLFLLVPYSIWPWFPFVWGTRWGFLVAAAMHILVAILAAISLAINIIFFNQMIVIMIIIHSVIIIWFLYMALVWFLFSKCAKSVGLFSGLRGAFLNFFKSSSNKGLCPQDGVFGDSVELVGKEASSGGLDYHNVRNHQYVPSYDPEKTW